MHGVTFINIGGRYPRQALTGVIFSDDTSKFPNLESPVGKAVDIAGRVQVYKGSVATQNQIARSPHERSDMGVMTPDIASLIQATLAANFARPLYPEVEGARATAGG
jgi:hypothetical protein